MSTGIEPIDARVDVLGDVPDGMDDFEGQARRQLAQAARFFLEAKPDDADVGSLINAIRSLEEAAEWVGYSVKLPAKMAQRKKAKTSQ